MFGKDVTEEYVCHYTTRETALEKILPSGNIMLNLLKNTNDPREYKDWGVTAIGGSDNNEPLWQALHHVNHSRTTKTKVLCLTMDDLNRHRLGLMRRCFAQSRMWTQYGQRHKGVCIVFEKGKLEAAIKKTVAASEACHFGPVEYSDKKVGIELNFNSMGETEENVRNGVEQFVQGNINPLYFTKSLDWREEMEYRMMVYAEGDTPIFVPVSDCITGVVLGSEFPEVDFPTIQSFSHKYGFQICQIRWQAGIPYVRGRS